MTVITKDKVEADCRMGRGAETCRYLAVGGEGFLCMKHVAETAAYIDSRVAAGTMGARGDNCEGVR